MTKYHQLVSKKHSMTMIEVLVDAAILSMLSVIVITSLLSSLRTTTKTSEIATAGQLVNEKMEILRNLAYDSLSTQNGAIFPQGNLLDNEVMTRDKKTLRVNTDIQYVDDPYDLLTPADTNPADYKKVTLTVFNNATNVQLAIISSNIASHAAETSSNTGVLKVVVLNASGVAVPNADINITNTTTNPVILINTHTDINGLVLIPNLKISGGYHVIASKNGYSTDSTYTGNTNPTPINPDASILLQQVTPVTLSIDTTSTISATFSGLNGSTPNASIVGQKLVGTVPDTIKTTMMQVLNPVTLIGNVEYDGYTISPETGWKITTCDPMQPFIVNPASTVSVGCALTQDNEDVLIKSITPRTVSATSGVTILIVGDNFSGATVSLQKGADPEIEILGLVAGGGNTTLDGNVDFTGVASGTYAVIIRNNEGKTTTQLNGIIVQ